MDLGSRVGSDANNLLGGVMPNQIESGAAGSSLDNTQSDWQRAQLQQLIASLTQQASTGNGAWQQSFAQAVHQARNNVSAIGQSQAAQARTGGADALRNIGNAQSSVDQRAVGEGDILRTQSENNAQDQLGQLLSSQGQGDIAQSAAGAAVNQQRREANAALAQQAKTQGSNLLSGAGAGIMAALSDGGRVPGQPRVFGDDSRNDTVPAMLSPQEIVVPISASKDPDKAAAFARAVAMRGGAKHLADGGDTGVSTAQGPTFLEGAGMVLAPHLGMNAYYSRIGGGPQAPSIENGGLLNTAPYEQTRGQMNALGSQFAARAAGDNSIAGTISQQQSDAQMEQALAVENQQRASMADVLKGTAAEGARGAGKAAGIRAEEQAHGQKEAGGFGAERRAQEMALAKAQQGAAWNNTMLNAGLTLQNQQALRNQLAAAGQAAAGLSSMGGPQGNPTTDEGPTSFAADTPASGYNTEGAGPAGQSGMGDFKLPDEGAPQGAAHGGAIHGYDEGGRVVRTGAVHSGQTEAALNAEYQANKAKAAIEKGPDVNYRLSQFVQAVQGGARKAAGKVGGMADGGSVDPSAIEGLRDGGPEVYWEPPDYSGRRLPASAAAEIEAQRPSGPPAGAGSMPGLMQAFAPGMPGGVPPDLEARQGGNPLDPASKALSTIPGLRPRGEAPAAAPPTTPAAAAAPKPRGGGMAEKPADTSAFDAERAAIEAQGNTKEQQAREEARAVTAYGEQLQASQIAQQQRAKLAQEEGSAMMARYGAALDEMKHIDTSVDPGRYWASRTTGQKVMGIIGLALGSLGSNDGTNKAAQMLGQAVDRDIEAQKSEAQARLKKGESALAASQTAYAMHRQLFQDDLAATAATKASMLELADNKLKQIAATYASPMAKQNAALLSAQLQQSKQQFVQQAKDHTVENELKRAQTADEWAKAGKDAAGGGKGLTESERKEVGDVTAAAKDAIGLIGNIKNTLGRTQSKIPGGTAYNQHVGGDAAQLDTDTAQLVAKMKDINKLGQIGPADKALLEEAIGDPKAIFTLEGTKRAKLDRVEQIIKDSVANQISSRGMR
jgi:hypothetical protein